MKADRLRPKVLRDGPAQALYALTLAALGGPANQAAFVGLSERLPLAALLDRLSCQADRPLAATAELKAAAVHLVLQRSGLRPQAAPARRLEAAARLVTRWWPAGCLGWPEVLSPGSGWQAASCPGLGRASSIEIMVNAVLPVALLSGAWPGAAVERSFCALPSPGTYGLLRPLERWLSAEGTSFTTASQLQGGLLLKADYCARGLCGSCPLSARDS